MKLVLPRITTFLIAGLVLASTAVFSPAAAAQDCTGLPDLLTGVITLVQSGPAGGWTPVKLEVGNAGGTAVTVPFSAIVFLSTDAVLDPEEDLVLARFELQGLAAGQVTTVADVGIIGTQLAEGTYHVGTVVDLAGNVLDCNPGNNVFVSSQPAFEVIAQSQDDHPNAPGLAQLGRDDLSDSVPVRDGSIEGRQDVDYFGLLVDVGRSYEVTVELGTMTDSVIDLYGPDGETLLLHADDLPEGGTASRLSFTAPATPLYARVRHFAAVGGTGTYRLRLTELSGDDHPDSAQAALTAGAVISEASPVVRGRIAPGGDVDFFRLEVTAGGTYALSTHLDDLPDTVLTLFGPDGTSVLAENDDAGSSRASRLVFTAPSAGPFPVRVRAFSNVQVGSYAVKLIRITGDDHPDTATGVRDPEDLVSTASPEGRGIIDSEGDVDFFKVVVPAGASFSLSTVLQGLADSVLTVFAADGVTRLGENDDAPGTRASRLELSAPEQGFVLAAVRAFRSTQTGAYTLRLDVSADDHPDTAAATQAPRDVVSDASPVTAGAIQPEGEVDFFRLDLSAGISYVVETELAGLDDTVLTVFGPDGVTQVAENDDAADTRASRLVVTAPAQGSLFARVRAFRADATGAYRLRIARLDDHPDIASATRDPQDTLSDSTAVVDGSIERGGDVDFFRLVVQPGIPYTVQTELTGLSDTVLTVFDTDGITVIIDSDDAEGTRASRATFLPVSSGPYFARIRAFDTNETGLYRIRLTGIGADDHPNTAVGLDPERDGIPQDLAGLQGSIDRAGDVDFFVATVTPGTSYSLVVETETLDGAMVLVSSEQGESLGSGVDGGPGRPASIDFDIPSNGSVTRILARVAPFYANDTGKYRIRLLVRAVSGGGDDDHPGTAAGTRDPEDSLSAVVPRQSGSFVAAGDVDFFRVEARRGIRHRILVLPSGGATVDAALLDGQGGSVVSGNGQQPFPLDFMGPSGIAALRVQASGGGAGGGYELELLRLDDRPDAVADVTSDDLVGIVGLALPGIIEVAGDRDLFSLRLTGGRPYRIEVSPEPGGRLSATLLAPDGTTTVASASSPGAGQSAVIAAVTPSADGFHFLRIEPAGSPSVPLRYRVTLVLPRPRVSVVSQKSSENRTFTVQVEGLPGPLALAIAVVDYDDSRLVPVAPFEETVGTIKHLFQEPIPGRLALVAAPATASQAGAGTETATLGVFHFTVPTGVEAPARGLLAPQLTLLVSGQDIFAVFAPQADAGLSQLFETFDAGGNLLPRIPDVAPRESQLGTFVRLDGRLSRDLAPESASLTYTWEVIDSPAPVALEEASSATPRFTPSRPGEYEVSLLVSNGQLESLEARTRVIVNRVGETPTAVIRAAAAAAFTTSVAPAPVVTVSVSDATVQLDGTASTTPIEARTATLTYRWRQIDGTPVRLLPSSREAAPTFTIGEPGLSVFELTVTDAAGSVSQAQRLDLLVLPDGDRAPRLSLRALSSTTSTIGAASDRVSSGGRDAGARSLRVTLPTTVVLEATVEDPEVAAGSQELFYAYTQIAGPPAQLAPAFVRGNQRTARSAFEPGSAGVFEFEVRVSEVLNGKVSRVAVRDFIRVVVDSSENGVPIALPVIRLAGGKGGPSAGATTSSTVTVIGGTSLELDGSGSMDTGPNAAERLGASWTQLAGPRVTLSNPRSALTSVVAPPAAGAKAVDLVFQLHVDDGTIRSEPAQVTVRVLPKTLQSRQLALRRGFNAVGLPISPAASSGFYSLADLARDTGSSFVVITEATGGRTRFRVVPGHGSAARAIPVEGGEGYLVLPGTSGAVQNATLSGVPWTEGSRARTLRPGWNLVHLPLGAPDGFTVQDLLEATSAAYAIVFESETPGGRTRPRVYMPALGVPPAPVAEGSAVMLWLSGSATRQVQLPKR